VSRITTVQDRNGDVWTGRQVDTSTPLTDVGAAVVSLGLTAVAQAFSGDSGERTVEVNGHRHTGHKVD
jgi:hypothetical protein